ncbi:MAG: FAD-dependent oxidoreductase [Lentisphaerae bacterium]|jgi:hypothetical protein|nr:FAD-dependent oxidoreductase [Lentisphaerota bacterium]MBT4814491.1 FAD-dependent oxidoreductase [Lentisphaerota bacterium]MBT5605224.1 FAD-dependent oxidoreductase [Lentisphaerota bacterium]MBT7054324.1 FAD-dependent oxidoreductase [Lentisphaerota bacterium]MBT7844892.1 FAD-dependent oxidoreductase [Lentisphaerota bacterium]
MDTFMEPSRRIPVLGEFDVVVCGAGAAGCAASIAAARHGARTLVIERDGFLGGATVSQLVGHVLSTNGVDFQGIWHEWIAQVRERGGVSAPDLIGAPGLFRLGVDPEVVKYAWDDLLSVAGVEILHHAWCSDCMVEDGLVRGVIVETKAGRRAICAKRVIDCTGDGAVCAAAGVQWEQGDGTNPWSQALTKVFRMGNVRWPEGGYRPEQITQARKALKQAVARGEFDSPVVANGRVITYSANNNVHRSVAPHRTEMNVFSSRVLHVNTLDPWDFTRAEREGREQAWQCAEFIKRHVPGFESSYLLDTNQHVGVRDTRRIKGRTTVTADDAWHFRKHAHGIAKSSWDIDMWPADSYDAPAVPREDPVYKRRIEQMKHGEYFDIPYGCIVAADLDNLLVAGRCVSAERGAQASLRIQQTCQSTGQAAGTAAALSLQEDVTPAELEPSRLVDQLAADRAAVTPVLATLRDLT